MKKRSILALLPAVCLCMMLFAACGVLPGDGPADGETTAVNENDGLRQAYRAILENILANPGGYYELAGSGDPEYTLFATADIDGDGAKELLVRFEDTAVAGTYMQTWKYDAAGGAAAQYRTFSVKTEFYATGYAAEGANHNQSMGSLWPYTVTRMDADGLTKVGGFYSMEKEIAGALFDETKDADGDGVIYFYTPEGGEPQPLTQAEYDALTAQYIPEAQHIAVEYRALTKENIEAALSE